MATHFHDDRTRRPPLGDLLRYWRGMRGKSQLDLALDSGVSQKHISFLETGRSTPSRQMVLDLAHALGIPLRERNELILAAGYAPVYSQDPPDKLPAEVDKAIQRMLRQHEPFPALLMDRYWSVVATNEAAPLFFGKFTDLNNRPRPRNLLHLIFDPAGLRPFIENIEDTAPALITRIYRECVGGVIDDGTRQLLAELSAYPDLPKGAAGISRRSDLNLPVLPIKFLAEGKSLPMFSLVTTVGSPQTVAVEELRVETLFPTDEEAERNYLAFIAGAPEAGPAQK